MTDLRYETPATLEAAAALLAAEDGVARILAGGTDVLVQMHSDMVEPALLVDIKRIGEVRAFAREKGGWRIGAAVSGKEMMENAEFNADWPGIMDGVRLIGSIQVRGRATIAGNLCNASPAADSVPPMIVAGALTSIVGPAGRREVPVAEVAVGPGKTTLGKGEIVASFFLPDRPPRSGGAYLRFTPRTEMDIAVVGVAVSLTLDDGGICTDAQVCLGAVAARALVVDEAAQAIVGTPVDDAAIEALARAASAASRPIDDKRGTIGFRTEVAAELARRVCRIALERAKG